LASGKTIAVGAVAAKPGGFGKSGSSVIDQKRATSSGLSRTTKSKPWLKPADGAWRALSRIWSNNSGSTGRWSNCRTMRRRWSTSWNDGI
jgi:hypothetical protein